MHRIIPHPGLTLLLIAVWIMMSSSVTLGTVLFGALIGIFLPIFTAPFWPRRPAVSYRAGLFYLAILLWDITAASFQVAWIILFCRNRELKPAWLVIPMELETPEAITALAGTISLTPGTVSSDVSACGRYLLVHALHVADPEAEIASIKQRYETRLKKVFR